MSTFTNILQQKINNLEAQIRQLQEQNAHLRNKAKLIKEYSDYSPSFDNPLETSDSLGQWAKDPGLLMIPDSDYWNYGTGSFTNVSNNLNLPALGTGNRMTDYNGNPITAPIWSNNGYWYFYESDSNGNILRMWQLRPGGQWQIM